MLFEGVFLAAAAAAMFRYPKLAVATAALGAVLFVAFWAYLIAAMYGGFGPYRVGE